MHEFLISAKDRTIHPKTLQLSFTPFFTLQSQFITRRLQSCFLNTFPACLSFPFSGINSVPISPHPVRSRIPLLWLQSLFPSSLSPTLGRNYLSCKWCLSPVYNLTMLLTAYILGSKSKFSTMRLRKHSLTLRTVFCHGRKAQPWGPTSMSPHHAWCVLCPKHPTSSSLCP